MKKLLSLFAALGLLGFAVAPIYAQDEQILDAEEPVYEAENVDEATVEGEAMEDYSYEVDDYDYSMEATDEDYAVDLGEIESFNDIFENEDVKAVIDEAGLTNEEAAGLLGGFAGLFAGLGMVGIIVTIIWAILAIVALWKVFTKAGEAGWKAIIPIYNAYIMYKIAGMKNWFWYTLIVAFVCWLIAGFLWEGSDIAGYISIAGSLFSGIVAIVAAYKLPRKFGWGVFASILYVLFTGICLLILGFGSSKYQGKSEQTVVEA